MRRGKRQRWRGRPGGASGGLHAAARLDGLLALDGRGGGRDGAAVASSATTVEDDLERVSMIDLRLEKVFRRDIDGAARLRLRRRRLQKQRLAPIEPEEARATLAKVGADPDPNVSFQSIGPAQANAWLDSLASGERDPVQVGKECIEVCGTEFDECVQFLAKDQRFIHDLFSAPSAALDELPRQVAEGCLHRGEKIIQIWRTEHRVLFQLMTWFERERDRFERDADPLTTELLDREINRQNKLLAKQTLEIDRLTSALEDAQGVLSALAVLEQGGDPVEIRSSLAQTAAPSGVTHALELLLERMSRFKSLARLNLNRSSSASSLIEDDEGDDQKLLPSLGNGSNARLTIVEEPEETTAGEGFSIETGPTAGATQQVSEDAQEGEGEDSFDDGDGMDSPDAAPISKVVGSPSRRRRASTILQDSIEFNAQKLDVIQRCQIIGSLLTKVDKRDLKTMVAALDEKAQHNLVGSLMEVAADGNIGSLLSDLLKGIDLPRDRVDLLVEFVKSLREEERDLFSQSIRDTLSNIGVNEPVPSDDDPKEDPTSTAQQQLAREKSSVVRLSRSPSGHEKSVQTEVSIALHEEPTGGAKHAIFQAIGGHLSTVGDDASGDDASGDDASDDEGKDDDESDRDGEESDAFESNLEKGSSSQTDSKRDIGKAAQNSGSNADDVPKAKTRKKRKWQRKKRGVLKVKPGMASAFVHGTTFAAIDVKNQNLLQEGGNLAMTVTLKRIDSDLQPIADVTLPWEKYFHKPPKSRKMRKIEVSQLENDIIGEVYQRKIQSDKSLRDLGRKPHSLAKTILHFFTQKYGLKKLAEEYLYGIVQTLRGDTSGSTRIRLFGILVGVLHPELYTQSLCDVVMEHLYVVFPSLDHVSKVFSHGRGKTYVQHIHAIRAVRTIFRLVDGELSREGAAPASGSGAPCVQDEEAGVEDHAPPKTQAAEVSRSWTIPCAFRQKLLRWIETNCVPESELNKSTSSDIKVIDCDHLLFKVAQVYLKKTELDRYMITELFKCFDINQDGVLSFGEFKRLLEQAQPCPALNESEIMDLWIEVNDMEDDEDDEKITPEAFASVCIRRQLELPYWKYDNDNVMVKLVRQLEEDL